MNPAILTLKSSLSENDAHQMRLKKAIEGLTPDFPLSQEKFITLSDSKIALIDQLVYRFTKMQDSLGTRLIPSLFDLLEESDRPKPFLDILNRLEQLELLEVESWQWFRELRNRIAHEYLDSLDQTISALNLLFESLPRFFQLYEVLKNEVLQRIP